MKKQFKYGAIALVLVLFAAVVSILVLRKPFSSVTEAFADTRAYRTEVSPDTEIFDEPLPGDPFAYPLSEELRNKQGEAFEIINTARQERGLQPFAWSERLSYGANVRAAEAALLFDGNHVRPNGAPWYTVEPTLVLGENIYKGKGDVQKVMESWLASSADSENFFSADFTKIAISIYKTDKGEYGWSALFSAE
jgi:uncharacterized protein YkwD